MSEKGIFRVEQNPRDEEQTLCALKNNNLPNKVVVLQDGAEALGYFFARHASGGQGAAVMPEVVLSGLNLSTIDGLQMPRRIPAGERTRMLPVVLLSSSNEGKDFFGAFEAGCNRKDGHPRNWHEMS